MAKNAVSSKGNVYLLFIEIFEKEFSSATWNVHAWGHGKAIGHGVGAALKRAADRRVLRGEDIMSCKSFADEVSKAGLIVKLYISQTLCF